MRLHSRLATAALLALSASLADAAGVTTLTFEGASGFLDTYYAGGTDSNGHSGPKLDVSFTLGIAVTDSKGGNAYGPPLDNVPSATTVLEQRGTTMTINKPSGFKGGFALAFASETSQGTVNVYSDADGGGKLLASFALTGEAQCPDAPVGSYYCNWQAAGVAFKGVAKSVTITVTDELRIFYDNLTFGAAVPVLGTDASVKALLG